MADKLAAAAAAEDMGEGMQCIDHPYQANPGGICAFCLQEKLGKLVSSSKLSGPFFPLQPPLSPSSSSPPASAAVASSASQKKKSGIGGAGIRGRKVSAAGGGATAAATFSTETRTDLVLKRSKSVAPRPVGGTLVPDGGGSSRLAGADPLTAESPRKKSFWSFLYSSPSSSASVPSNPNYNIYSNRRRSTSSSGVGAGRDLPKQQLQPQIRDDAIISRKDNGNEPEEAGSPSSVSQASSSFGRKVARSRSVGCGSRSFSGDFLERISTGFGDCALRRVESHREAKAKIVLRLDHADEDDEDEQQLQRRMKERVKCGLFGGFGMMSSSLWLSAGLDDDLDNCNRISAATPTAAAAAAVAVVRGLSSLSSEKRRFTRFGVALRLFYLFRNKDPIEGPRLVLISTSMRRSKASDYYDITQISNHKGHQQLLTAATVHGCNNGPPTSTQCGTVVTRYLSVSISMAALQLSMHQFVISVVT